MLLKIQVTVHTVSSCSWVGVKRININLQTWNTQETGSHSPLILPKLQCTSWRRTGEAAVDDVPWNLLQKLQQWDISFKMSYMTSCCKWKWSVFVVVTLREDKPKPHPHNQRPKIHVAIIYLNFPVKVRSGTHSCWCLVAWESQQVASLQCLIYRGQGGVVTIRILVYPHRRITSDQPEDWSIVVPAQHHQSFLPFMMHTNWQKHKTWWYTRASFSNRFL